MPIPFETAPGAIASAVPITFVTPSTWEAIRDTLSAAARQFAAANGFTAKPGASLILPGPDGQIAQVLFGLEDATAKSRDPFRPGKLPTLLPTGVYRFGNTPHDARLATLAFALGSYRFSRYRKAEASTAKLVPSDGIDVAEMTRIAGAATLARDLVNTPSNDMGP
jgi:leucyl aminopeptidase